MVGIWDIALIAGIFIYRQQILDFITKAGQSIAPTAAPTAPPAAPPATPPPSTPAPSGPSTSPSPSAPAQPITPPVKNQTGGTPTTVSPQKEKQTLKTLRNKRATPNVMDPCAAFIGQPSTYAQCRKVHGLLANINIGYIDYGYDAGYGYGYPYDTYDYIPEEYEQYFLGY